MANKQSDKNNGPKRETPKLKGTENAGKKKKTTNKRKRKGVVDHAITARWIQEQLQRQIPELGMVSDALIEKILKLEHKRYIMMGYSRLTFVSDD